MSLIGALNIGKSALATQQAAIQVTGNNIANAGNADYARQVANTATNPDQELQQGIFVGRGISLSSVQRQIDDALEGRLRSSIADASGAATASDWMSRVEGTFNELTDDDLSTKLSTFFNSWSNLANTPQDPALRQVVLQSADTLSKSFQSMNGDLTSLQGYIDTQLQSKVSDADQLASQIATLNGQVAVAEGGTGGTANGLRDQRDALLKQLSELVNVKTVEQPSGMVNVYIGSEPLISNNQSYGLAMKTTVDATGKITPQVVFKDNGGPIPATTGSIGALLDVRNNKLSGVIDQVNGLASNLIFELNKVYSSGQGLEGFSSVKGTSVVADAAAALNSKAAGLANPPANGSFVVHVTNKSTGLSTSTLVEVKLDGTGAQTSLNSLTAALNGVAGVNASVNAGQLSINSASSDSTITFSQDSSGALASLGVNSFFTGKDARDIAVNSTVTANPNLLAASANGQSGDNQTALGIAKLASQKLAGLNNVSLNDSYQAMVEGVAVDVSTAKSNSDAATAVNQTIESQRESLSGVSLDEEAINLMRQQRAFQGAARLVAAVDDMMKSIIALV